MRKTLTLVIFIFLAVLIIALAYIADSNAFSALSYVSWVDGVFEVKVTLAVLIGISSIFLLRAAYKKGANYGKESLAHATWRFVTPVLCLIVLVLAYVFSPLIVGLLFPYEPTSTPTQPADSAWLE